MAVNVLKYRGKIGVFINEIDMTVQEPAVQEATIQLIPGFSKRGTFNRPVYLTNTSEARRVFGPVDFSLEAQGSFFHRTLFTALRSGPVYGLNLLSVNDDLDKLNYISASIQTDKFNDMPRYEGISFFYDRDAFWERDVRAAIQGASRYLDPIPFTSGDSPRDRLLKEIEKDRLQIEIREQERILHFVNMGQETISVFAIKRAPLGFDDVTIEDWYMQMADTEEERLVPKWIHPKSMVSDYFIRIYVISGDWSDYENLAQDRHFRQYFDKTGIIKEQLDRFATDPKVTLLNFFDASLIPYFRDGIGNDYHIESVVNERTDETGLYVAYDVNKLEATDYPMGLVDIVGNNIVDKDEVIVDFLSYKENLSEIIKLYPKTLNRPGNMFYKKGDYVINGPDGRSPGSGTPERVGYYEDWNVYNSDTLDKSEFRTHGVYAGGSAAELLDPNNLHNSNSVTYSNQNIVDPVERSIRYNLVLDEDAYAVIGGRMFSRDELLNEDGTEQFAYIFPIKFPNQVNYMRVDLVYLDANGELGVKRGTDAPILEATMPEPPVNAILLGYAVTHSELDLANPASTRNEADPNNAVFHFFAISVTGKEGIAYLSPEQDDTTPTFGYMESKYVDIYSNTSNLREIHIEFNGTSELQKKDPNMLGDGRMCALCNDGDNVFTERFRHYYHWKRAENIYRNLVSSMSEQSVLVGRNVVGSSIDDWMASERWYKNPTLNRDVVLPASNRDGKIVLTFDHDIISPDDGESELTSVNNKKVKGTLKNSEGGASASYLTISSEVHQTDRTENYADTETLEPITIDNPQFVGGEVEIRVFGAKNEEITSPITITGAGRSALNQSYSETADSNTNTYIFTGVPYGPYDVTVTANVEGTSVTETKKIFVGHFNSRLAYLNTRWTAMDLENEIGNKNPNFVLDFDTPANIERYFPLEALALPGDMSGPENYDGSVIIYAAGGNPVDTLLAPDYNIWDSDDDWNPTKGDDQLPNPRNARYRFIIDDEGRWQAPPQKPEYVGNFEGKSASSPYLFTGLKDLQYKVIVSDRFGFSDDIEIDLTIRGSMNNKTNAKVWARDFTVYFVDDEFIPGKDGWSSRRDAPKPPVTGYASGLDSIGVAGHYSDAYKYYIDGFINSTDYFNPVIFLEDDKSFTEDDMIKFNPDNNSITFPKAYWENNDTVSINYLDLNEGRQIRIEGTQFNNTTFTLAEDISSNTELGTEGDPIYVKETVIREEILAKNVSMYVGDRTIYTKMGVTNGTELSVKFYEDSEFTTPTHIPLEFNVSSQIPIGDYRFYQYIPLISLKSNYKQSVDIIERISDNEIVVDFERYSELVIGEYLEAYFNPNNLGENEMPRKLARIVETARRDPNNMNHVYITTDVPIRIREVQNGGITGYQTNSFKEIENYVTTYKPMVLKGFNVRRESMPDGTEERMNKIISVMRRGESVHRGLTSDNIITYRYLIDSFGLGLQSNSKQVYLDVLEDRMDAFGILNMPSAFHFKNSYNPRFINPDGTLNYNFLKDGGDRRYSPEFYYTFGSGRGNTYVGYFFPYLRVTDYGRPSYVPPSGHVGQAFMRKFNAFSGVSGVGQAVAGIQRGRLTGIDNVEIDVTTDDLAILNSMNANVIVYDRDNGFYINTDNTAQASPRSALSYTHIRETLIQLEIDLKTMLKRFQWRINNEDTREEIKYLADKICDKYLNLGYLNNYLNIMDETNNPTFIIESQMGVLDTYVEPTYVMATIVNNITIVRTGVIESGGFNI